MRFGDAGTFAGSVFGVEAVVTMFGEAVFLTLLLLMADEHD